MAMRSTQMWASCVCGAAVVGVVLLLSQERRSRREKLAARVARASDRGKNSPARRPGSAAGLSNAAYRASIHGWAAVEAGKPRERWRSNAELSIPPLC